MFESELSFLIAFTFGISSRRMGKILIFCSGVRLSCCAIASAFDIAPAFWADDVDASNTNAAEQRAPVKRQIRFFIFFVSPDFAAPSCSRPRTSQAESANEPDNV